MDESTFEALAPFWQEGVTLEAVNHALLHHKGYPEIDLKEHPLGEHDEQPFQAFCIDYGPDEIEEQEITDFNGFFDAPRPDWSVVRWIRVIGRPRPEYLKTLAERYHFHPLALEDLIQTPQRPKVDKYFDDMCVGVGLGLGLVLALGLGQGSGSLAAMPGKPLASA